MTKHYNNVYKKRFGYFNIYIIKGENGDILIDTGFIGIKKQLKKWLDNFNVKLVILTHAHVDHIWNTSYIKKLYNCKVAIGIKDIDNIDNTKINSKPLRKKYILWTKLMNFGMKKFIPEPFNIDLTLKDNQIINNFGINLKILELPGHTSGSIGVLYNDYLFVGDALVNRGKYPGLAFQNQSNNQAYESLKRILNTNTNIVFLGHDREFNLTTKIKNFLINQ